MAGCVKIIVQKLSKYDNSFSSYSRKCRESFFGTQCSVTYILLQQLATWNQFLKTSLLHPKIDGKENRS